MKKSVKMYMLFMPDGHRCYEVMRFTAKAVKEYWTGGDLQEWKTKWHAAGWRIYPVTVEVKLISKTQK